MGSLYLCAYLKGVAEIASSFILAQFRLRLGLFDPPADPPFIRHRVVSAQLVCEFNGLVESTLAKPQGVQGDGDQQIGPHMDLSQSLDKQSGQGLYEMEFLLELEPAYQSVDGRLVSKGGDGLGKRWSSPDTVTAPLCRRDMGWQRQGAAGTGMMIEGQGVFAGRTKLMCVITRGATENTVPGIEL